MQTNVVGASNGILSGWKDIAKYLGISVRSVQRYEHELHLPIRRFERQPRGSVVAMKSELDGWVSIRPKRSHLDSMTPGLNESALEELKANLHAMRQLRRELQLARGEISMSLATLQKNICLATTGLKHVSSKDSIA